MNSISENIKPEVSVIMVVFNAKAYLKEAIDSILGQTCSNFEFLIADDGSTDATVDMLRSYEKQDCRIKLFLYKENKGQTYRLNQLIQQAQGEFIARMDGDDISLPHRIERQLQYLKTHPNCVLLGTQMYLLYQNEHLKAKPLPTDKYSIRFYAFFNNPFSHPSVIIKTRELKKMDGYPQKEMAQDYALWSKIIYKYETANLTQILLHNRIHPQSKSMTKRQDQKKIALQIAKQNLAYFLNNWSLKNIDCLFGFLKLNPTEISEVIKGWRLYKQLIKEYFGTYPQAKHSLSFLIFLSGTTLNFLWIKFSIITWRDKWQLLRSLV